MKLTTATLPARVEAAELAGQPRLRGALDERAVPGAAEELHRPAAVEVRREDVQAPVVVEVVDDDAAGRREGVDTRGGRHVHEAAHVLGRAKGVGGDAVRQRDERRIPAGRHERGVQQPPRLEVVGLAREAPCEGADGQIEIRRPAWARAGPGRERQEAAIAGLAVEAGVERRLVQAGHAEHLLEVGDGRGDMLDRHAAGPLELGDRLRHLAAVGVELAERHVRLHHLVGREAGVGVRGVRTQTPRERGLDGRHRLPPQLADRPRALVPVPALGDRVQGVVGLGEPVDAQRGPHAPDRGQRRNLGPARRRPHRRPGQLHHGEPGGHAQHGADLAGAQTRQRVPDLGPELGERDRADEASLGGRGVDRLPPGERGEAGAAPELLDHLRGPLPGADDDDAEGDVPDRRLRRPRRTPHARAPPGPEAEQAHHRGAGDDATAPLATHCTYHSGAGRFIDD
jgi:hypothetical protein